MSSPPSIMGSDRSAPFSSRQIHQALRERIEAGGYTVGTWLPTERDLATEFGVHRRVVRDVIALLAREGRLICRPRCRPLVADTLPETRSLTESFPLPADAAGSRLVALIMWHGGFEARATAQQRIFWGFNRALAQKNYHGVFLDLGDEIESEDENAAREAAHLQYALEHKFAGIAFYPYAYRRNRDLIRETAKRVPLVLIDRQIPGIETDYVGIDNLSAMQEATCRLQAQGHTRIALITRSEPINTVQDRITGYRTASQEACDHVITVNSPLEWSMFDLVLRLPAHERPTALLCVNDAIALQVAERLAIHGIRIPEDVALVGFDDLVQALPQGIGLSSVAQPFEKIGAAAADLLLKRIAEPMRSVRHIELPTALVIRGSSQTSLPEINFGPLLVSS